MFAFVSMSLSLMTWWWKEILTLIFGPSVSIFFLTWSEYFFIQFNPSELMQESITRVYAPANWSDFLSNNPHIKVWYDKTNSLVHSRICWKPIKCSYLYGVIMPIKRLTIKRTLLGDFVSFNSYLWLNSWNIFFVKYLKWQFWTILNVQFCSQRRNNNISVVNGWKCCLEQYLVSLFLWL